MCVTVGTMALVIILSVFNGFDNLVSSLINSFNPDLKVILASGKTFIPSYDTLNMVRNIPGVYDLSTALEDRALVHYDEQQTIAVVKGVSNNYGNVTGIDSMVVEGYFDPSAEEEPLALIGRGIRIYLNVMILSPRQMVFYVPRRTGSVTFDAARALNRKYITVSGVFSIEQDYDLKYIIVPLSYAGELFDYKNGEVNMLEVKLEKNANSSRIKEKIQELLGERFIVQDRYQQNEIFFKTMKAEKWAIFLILIFILIVASFNIIGTLTMLMIEKKKDMLTLSNMGADTRLIRRIFLFEGWMVSASGAVAGTIVGLLVCWLQEKFELISLQNSGTFIIDAYPVSIVATDVAATFFAVLLIGFIAAWYPVRFFTRKHIADIREE